MRAQGLCTHTAEEAKKNKSKGIGGENSFFFFPKPPLFLFFPPFRASTKIAGKKKNHTTQRTQNALRNEKHNMRVECLVEKRDDRKKGPFFFALSLHFAPKARLSPNTKNATHNKNCSPTHNSFFFFLPAMLINITPKTHMPNSHFTNLSLRKFSPSRPLNTKVFFLSLSSHTHSAGATPKL